MGELVGMDGLPQGDEAAVSGAPAAIRAFDQDGREVMVPREDWRTQILPGMLEQAREDSDQSYMLIVNSLQDGFLAEVMEATEHLYKTDTIPARGTCLWGMVLLQSGRADEAEAVLKGFGSEDGSVLTNLARVYMAKGETAKAEATLWRAIELDPNLDVAAGLYVEQAQARGEVQAALDRLAGLPGSWRASLWLARQALAAGDVDGAMTLYRQALEVVKGLGLPAVPGDFLMQMSGDLGGAGRIAELVELTGPCFVPEMHGLPVGNNLIKAHCDLGQLDEASGIVQTLLGFQRPEWRQTLGQWEQEIQRRRGGTEPAQMPGQMQIGMLRVDGPVWLSAGSPGRQMFGEKTGAEVAVTFLGGTAEGAPEIADAVGRMSRALPLFLAEQVELKTAALGRAMLPWAVGAQSGFVIGGAAWTNEQAVAAVAATPGQQASTYVVSVHLDATEEPWTAELEFVRVIDGVRIGEMDAEFSPRAPEDGLPELAEEMVDLLAAVAPGAGSESGRYVVPGGVAFGGYLLKLEQLLAVRCASMEVGPGAAPPVLYGEAEMLDGLLAGCEEMPGNVPLRMLLIETMSAMHRVRPDVVEAYRERVERLMIERPIGAV